MAVLVECTDSALDPGNPGVVRTTRLLGRELQRDGRVAPVFILWDRSLRDYRLLRADERERLACYGGPRDDGRWRDLAAAVDAARPAVLFLSEAPVDGQLGGRLLWAYARDMKVAAMLYDLIPLSHPVLCVPDIVRRFPDYVEGIAGVDALFPISAESLRQLERYAAEHELALPARRRAVWLPAQFGSTRRDTGPVAAGGGPVRCLSVGSIEPRKNQANLIAAFESLVRRRPGLGLELTLVGNRFAGAEALAERIDALSRELASLRWSGIVDDEALAGLYAQSAFTVYPSLVEGFGLPIMESLWLGRPCLCHADGVMAELAAGGGCLTVDMNDVGAIETALERLATDAGLRERLGAEARGRALRDWPAYGAEIARGLLGLAPADG